MDCTSDNRWMNCFRNNNATSSSLLFASLFGLIALPPTTSVAFSALFLSLAASDRPDDGASIIFDSSQG
jgi:hypothetical protein